MIGVATFIVGLFGAVALSVFFLWEQRNGVRVFKQARARFDKGVSLLYRTFVFGEVPHTYQTSFVSFVRHTLHHASRIAIGILKQIEKPLTRMSHQAYVTRSREGERTPSPFLKDIAESARGNGKKDESSL